MAYEKPRRSPGPPMPLPWPYPGTLTVPPGWKITFTYISSPLDPQMMRFIVADAGVQSETFSATQTHRTFAAGSSEITFEITGQYDNPGSLPPIGWNNMANPQINVYSEIPTGSWNCLWGDQANGYTVVRARELVVVGLTSANSESSFFGRRSRQSPKQRGLARNQ